MPFEAATEDDGGSKKSRKSKNGKGMAVDRGPPAPSVVHGEEVHSAKSLMKRAILMSGSRDMSAQLFTCL